MENLHIKNLNDYILLDKYRHYAEQNLINIINNVVKSELLLSATLEKIDIILNKLYPSIQKIYSVTNKFNMTSHILKMAKTLNNLSNIKKINKDKLLFEFLNRLKSYDRLTKELLKKYNEGQINKNNLKNKFYLYEELFSNNSILFIYNIICKNYIKTHPHLNKQFIIFNEYRKQKYIKKYLKDVKNIYNKITKNIYKSSEDMNLEAIDNYCLKILDNLN